MAYGEMRDEALKWAAQSAFGLNPMSMPVNIAITPLKVAETFPDLLAILEANALAFKKAGAGYLVWDNSQGVLFCE